MVNDIFRSARSQGGVFHALISISAHASLLAEIAQLKQSLAAEKELVAELGQARALLRLKRLQAAYSPAPDLSEAPNDGRAPSSRRSIC